ncbi:unnamed protein product [Arabis nemorensis]|uniref:beta-galactosidase n=1 Tax=Arabis nemorensis TaxID=586526 RepID=A0A565BRV3_9BRAS|nr:unnamed protein product [Arabis nemorensis]
MLAMGGSVEKHLKDPIHRTNLQYGLRTGLVCMDFIQIDYIAVYFSVHRLRTNFHLLPLYSYQTYGEDTLMRSAEDITFHVALFIAKNGSFVNYYMYHGGTNFGRNGSPFVTTSYYDQAPLDEYGLLRQPKWGHLKELHAAVKLCEKPLLSRLRTTIYLGKLQTSSRLQERGLQHCQGQYDINAKCSPGLSLELIKIEQVVWFSY